MRRFLLGTAFFACVIIAFCAVGLVTGRYDFLWLGAGLFLLIYFYIEEKRKHERLREFSLEIKDGHLISRGKEYELKSPIILVKRVIVQRGWSGNTKSVVLKFGVFAMSKIEGLDNLDEIANELASAIGQGKPAVAWLVHR